MKEAYIRRCTKRLKELKAPLENWYCVNMIDMMGADGEVQFFTCELCGCKNVRYVHEMAHDDFDAVFSVGCECAGLMEGDEMEARERDKRMKKRVRDKNNFVNQNWKTAKNGAAYLRIGKDCIFINRLKSNCLRFSVTYQGRRVWQYQNKPITSFYMASCAAFDMVYPIEAIV